VIGDRVLPLNLDPGDIIHIEHRPHDGPCLIGHRAGEVEVAATPEVIRGMACVCWRDCMQFPGASETVCGVAVLDPHECVIRIGHAA
jgi:hypothetical protein